MIFTFKICNLFPSSKHFRIHFRLLRFPTQRIKKEHGYVSLILSSLSDVKKIQNQNFFQNLYAFCI